MAEMADDKLAEMAHVIKLLVAEVEVVEQRKKMLRASERRRNVLIAKLRRAGMTLRDIEPYAGISNAAISQNERREQHGT